MMFSHNATYRLLFTKYATKVNPATTKTASKPGSGLLVEPLDCAEALFFVSFSFDLGGILTALLTPANAVDCVVKLPAGFVPVTVTLTV